jgi:hypothetical protein
MFRRLDILAEAFKRCPWTANQSHPPPKTKNINAEVPKQLSGCGNSGLKQPGLYSVEPKPAEVKYHRIKPSTLYSLEREYGPGRYALELMPRC